MVGENLEYSIRATDDSGPAAESFLARWTGEDGVWGRWRASAAAAAAFAAAALDDVVNRAQEIRRSLQRGTGTTAEGEQDALSFLLGIGAQEGDALAAVQAIAGPGQRLGLGTGDRDVLAALAGLSARGGAPGDALQALSGFGLAAADVAPTLDLAFGTAAAAGISASELTSALREYGPVFNVLGLSVLEAAAFIVDLANQGINVSRVSPALNRFIRDASAAGRSPREEALGAFEAIRQASPIDAAALGQELFGAEGGLRLTAAIRSGEVGLGTQLLPDDITSILTLASQIAPTDRELASGLAAQAGLEGGVLGTATNALVGGAGRIPFGLGGLLQSAAGEAAALAGAGLEQRTLNQNQQVIDLLVEMNANLASLNANEAYNEWLRNRTADEANR